MSSDPPAKGPRRNIRIGKYEVLSHVATGGMGAVYKARDTETGQDVALKVMSPEFAAKPAMVERFRREAKHAAKLRHENVVALHEFNEANRTYFLVMEFIDGIDLQEYITQKKALEPEEALEIVIQACRAIDHAYQQGVIHRDIKPSNFLLAKQGDRMVVKLTDLGLAREANNEEFRVTRAGTTIGTLDYMSPEQARDSGLADVRSDLYSLGCTWYHLLAGHAPFPKGGLGERLHRILHEEPTDVRQHNPRVPEAMASILHRLLAKRPSQRYQTPADLLRDLEALKRGETLLTPRQALESLAEEEGEPVPPPRPKHRPKPTSRRTPHPSPARSRSDTKTGKSTAEVPIPESEEKTPPYLLYVISGVTAVVLIVSVAVALSVRRGHRDETPMEQIPNPIGLTTGRSLEAGSAPSIPRLPENPRPDVKPASNPGDDSRNPILPPSPSGRALYQPAQPIDAAALRKEIEAPWVGAAPDPRPTIELVVGRLPPDASGRTFRSLAAACKMIPAGATGILELRDNGPFFDVPAAVADRNIVIRAAKGYHPLLVWDVQRTLEERRRGSERREASSDTTPLVFLDVRHGNLKLQGLHLACKWPDTPSTRAALLAVEDGDLSLQDCTFSVAGKPRDGLSLVRFTSSAGTGQEKTSSRCRLERCYARGAKTSMLDLKAPGATVLLENCLLVGEDVPLMQVQAANDRATRISVVRSTMICSKTMVDLQPAQGKDREPILEWLSWDTLLSRKEPQVGGELLHLSNDLDTAHVSWRAVNCLYAGWGHLVAGSKSIAGTDLAAWQQLWRRSEGDVVQAERWPTAHFPEPAEVPAHTYDTAGSLVAFAASAAPEQLLGCDLDRLPKVHDNWLSFTYDRFAILSPTLPDDASPPDIPDASDGLFHGARVDLDQTDLGIYLQTMQASYRLAPQVILRLSGSGERLTTPLIVKGSSLVLYFDPPPEKKEPLTLVPAGRTSAEALVDVEQGSVTLINCHLRFSEAAEARMVPWLIRVRGGDLRLLRTHLEVPPRNSGAIFRGLISMQGSGELAAERAHVCIIKESLLVSARDALALEGIGARMLLTQTLLIAGENALHLALDPAYSQKATGPLTSKANVQCLFDHATVAARSAVLHLPDVQPAGPPIEPVIVQSHHCGFVSLFGRTARPSLVRYEGESLAHGLLLWQSDHDGFDHRLWFGALCTSRPPPDKPEEHASWIALWGSPGLRSAQLDLLNYRTLDSDRWALDQRLAAWKVPGADLEKLGIFRKTASKLPR